MREKSLRKYGLLACAAILISLVGCGGTSLDDRAVIKAVYLNERGGQVEAALAVFTCEASADTASSQGIAQVYTATGNSIDEALYQAERQQNQKPFYAQNELLLLGPGVVREDITPYLAYFEQENAARPNMAVFLTPLSLRRFSACADVLPNVVQEAQRIVDGGAQDAGAFRTIYEAAPGDGKASGWLPALSFSPEEGAFIGVQSLTLLHQGKAVGTLRDTQMHLALLLAGKSNRLEITDKLGSRPFTLRTQPLHLEKTPDSAGHLTVCLRGAVEEISVDGNACSEAQMRRLLPNLNEYLRTQMEQLHAQTFEQGNDVFRFAWWLHAQNALMAEELEAQGRLYSEETVRLTSALTILQQ